MHRLIASFIRWNLAIQHDDAPVPANDNERPYAPMPAWMHLWRPLKVPAKRELRFRAVRS